MFIARPEAPSRRRMSVALALRASICLGPIFVLAGCAAFPTLSTVPSQPSDPSTYGAGLEPFPNGASTDVRPRISSRTALPGAPVLTPTALPATEAQIAAIVPDEMVDATLAPQTVPQFVSTVFGGVLGIPFTMTQDVAGRTELISGGTGGTLSKRDLFRLTQQALKQYGIEVYISGNFVTVGNPQPAGGQTIRRDRTPAQVGGRVVQIFSVQTIEVNVLQELIGDLYPNLGNARITPDQNTNSLIITGNGRDVAEVVRTLRELDQPRFAGANVLRLEPVYLPVDAFLQSLEQALVTEGYLVSRSPTTARAITMLPFPASNQVLVFAHDQALLDRVEYWTSVLDQPGQNTVQGSTFVYQVQNTDADSIGRLAIGQAPAQATPTAPVGVPGTPAVRVGTDSASGAGATQASSATRNSSSGGEGATGQFLGGRLLTDTVSNRIIFTGTATDFAQLRRLLQTLDTPAPQVVIEVMIAEVSLSDVTRLGLNFSGVDVDGDETITVGTNGIAIGSGGLLATFVGPDFRATLNAEASNDRINILQRPQLVVRSGGTARFQVGTDVPIITSQRATDSSSDGEGTDILQSVQYRQTGVILDLKPVVYGDRVDITISQENSSAGASPPGISSPTILNRSLTTQIAIGNGLTGVLGGLISNNYNTNNTGVPFLKDLPLIGSAFQNNLVEGDRSEILILITPYIIRGDEDMADFAERYASDMNAAFRTGRGWSYTLTPFSLYPGQRGLGLDLPSSGRPTNWRQAPADPAPTSTELGDGNPPPEPPAEPEPAPIVVTPPPQS